MKNLSRKNSGNFKAVYLLPCSNGLLEAGLQEELADHSQEEKVSSPDMRNRRNRV